MLQAADNSTLTSLRPQVHTMVKILLNAPTSILMGWTYNSLDPSHGGWTSLYLDDERVGKVDLPYVQVEHHLLFFFLIKQVASIDSIQTHKRRFQSRCTRWNHTSLSWLSWTGLAKYCPAQLPICLSLKILSMDMNILFQFKVLTWCPKQSSSRFDKSDKLIWIIDLTQI